MVVPPDKIPTITAHRLQLPVNFMQSNTTIMAPTLFQNHGINGQTRNLNIVVSENYRVLRFVVNAFNDSESSFCSAEAACWSQP